MSIVIEGQFHGKGQTASFFVDAQKGFTPLCPDELPVPGGHEIVFELLELAKLATVHVASGDEHPKNAHFFADAENPQFSHAPAGSGWDVRWQPHCVIGTRGAELLDGLPPKSAYDLYIPKGTQIDKHPYGALYYDLHDSEATGVVELLRARGVSLVLVGGLATDYCVKNTVLQLCRHGFAVVVDLAACRGIAQNTVAAAIADMHAAGAVVVPDVQALRAMQGGVA